MQSARTAMVGRYLGRSREIECRWGWGRDILVLSPPSDLGWKSSSCFDEMMICICDEPREEQMSAAIPLERVWCKIRKMLGYSFDVCWCLFASLMANLWCSLMDTKSKILRSWVRRRRQYRSCCRSDSFFCADRWPLITTLSQHHRHSSVHSWSQSPCIIIRNNNGPSRIQSQRGSH